MSHTSSDHEPATVHAGQGENASRELVSHMEPDNIGVAAMSILFALVAIVILLIVVLLQAWFYNWKVDVAAELQRNPAIDAQQTPAAIAADQLQRIETFGWADPKTKKDRTIPIGLAMERIVEENAAPAPTDNAPEAKAPSSGEKVEK